METLIFQTIIVRFLISTLFTGFDLKLYIFLVKHPLLQLICMPKYVHIIGIKHTHFKKKSVRKISSSNLIFNDITCPIFSCISAIPPKYSRYWVSRLK